MAHTLGEDQALKIYLALLDHTRQVALAVHAHRCVYYSQFIDHNDAWTNPEFTKHLQIGTDLGQRMQNAFATTMEKEDKTIIIGSDCPGLNAEVLEEAYQQLDRHPFVIGPALDGGYYLLGMRQYRPAVFQGINWSTEQVLPQTLRKIKEMGATAHLLPALSDVDYEEDWQKYGWEL